VNGQAYIALGLAFIALGAILVAPLAQFIYEESINPKTFLLTSNVNPYNSTHVEIMLTISYNGTVPLNDVKANISLGGKILQAYREKMKMGDSLSIRILYPIKDVEKISALEADIKFTISQLYPVEVKVVRI
jgi:hypothetical protein